MKYISATVILLATIWVGAGCSGGGDEVKQDPGASAPGVRTSNEMQQKLRTAKLAAGREK